MVNKLFKRTVFLAGLILVISMMFGMTVFASNENSRYIMDAETLPDNTIAVLFIRGGTTSSGVISGGNLYYGIYNPTNDGWNEIPVGVEAPIAKEAALALSDSVPHIVYITGEDKIAYVHTEGSGWSEPVIIESNNCNDKQGVLYAPDIAVDTNGKAHITYMDTQGATDDYYKNDDGIYATNKSGAFVKNVVANGTGWYEAGDGGDRNIPSKPVKISLIDDDYNIIYKNQNSSRGGYGGWEHWYTFEIKATSNKYVDSNSGGMIYEASSDGTNFYTLISQSGIFKVLNSNVAITETEKAISASIADMTLDGSDIYYATINGSTVVLYQDGTFKEDLTADTAILSSHNKLATVIADGEQYIIYTGNDEDNSLVITKFDSTDEELVEFLVPNAPTTYTLTLLSNVSSCKVEYDTVRYNSGDTLDFEAGTEVRLYGQAGCDYEFDEATSSEVSLESGETICRYFTMPEEDVIVTFNFIPLTPEGTITMPAFDDANLDYEAISSKSINVALTHNTTLDPDRFFFEQSGEGSGDFEITTASGGVWNGNGSWGNRFSINPKQGLSAGTHTATITLKYTKVNDEVVDIDSKEILFTVTEPIPVVTEYDLWVNGKQFTSEKTSIVCGDGTATFDADNNTLTLENATIDRVYGYQYGVINSSLPNLIINLVGNNVIDGQSNNDGIDADGGCNITITGSGTLTMNNMYYGTYIGSYDVAGGDLTIKDTTVNVTSAICAGLWVNHNINFINSNVQVKKTNGSYNGIVSNIDGTITVDGGKIKVDTVKASIHMGNTDDSNHIIVLNSGSLTLKSAENEGIHVEAEDTTGNINGTIEINGGILKISSGTNATNIPAERITIADGYGYTLGEHLTTSKYVIVEEIIEPTGSVTAPTFESVEVGYPAIEKKAIEVKLTNKAVIKGGTVQLISSNTTNFSTTCVLPNENLEGPATWNSAANFAVGPKNNLSAGTYTTTITIKAKGLDDNTYILGEAEVSFTVTEPVPVVTEYDLWVGNTRVTSVNASDILGDGKVSYDVTTNTLTLNGATITGAGDENHGYGIKYQGNTDLTIVADGTSIISDNTSRKQSSAGILLGGTIGEYNGSGYTRSEYQANLIITLNEGATLNVNAGEAIAGTYPQSCGICIWQEVGNVTINGSGTLNVKGGNSSYSYGINAPEAVTFNSTGNTTISTTDGSYYNDGIYAQKKIIFNSGNVTVTGGNSTDGQSYAIATDSDWDGTGGKEVIINGGNIVLCGGDASFSYGISAGNSIQINDGTLEVKVLGTGDTAKVIDLVPTLASGLLAGASTNSDGSNMLVYKAEDNDSYKWYKVPVEPIQIDTITITGLVEPVVGEGQNTSSLATATEGITITDFNWETLACNSVTTFEAGTKYQLYILFTVDAGYELASSYEVTRDEEFGEVASKGTSSIYITYTVPEATPTTYTITYNLNGGTPGETYRSSVELPIENATIDVTEPPASFVTPPEGKVFDAVEINGTRYEVGSSYTVTGDFTIKLLWKDIEITEPAYTVTFNTDGGSSVTSQTVVSGEKATKPTDPTNGVWHFYGWFEDLEHLENEFSFNTSINQNITLNALWYLETNVVTEGVGKIDASLSDKTLEPIYGSSYNKVLKGITGTTLRLLANPGEDYRFVAWINQDTDEEISTETSTSIEVSKDMMNIVAVFELVEYDVTYDANGGTGTMSGETSKYYIFPSCEYTAPDGKKFDKWEVNGKTYKVGDTLTLTEDITVKAIWKNKSTSSGGGGGSSSSSYKVTTKTENATIIPNLSSVKKGATQEFKFTAEEGYEIADVLIDGKSVGAVDSYTLENVKEKHTIEVKTAKVSVLENIDEWAKEEMAKAEEKGLIPETFAKKDAAKAITRIDFAAVAVKLYEAISGKKAEKATSNPFTDTNDEYVLKAYALGITKGTSETTFTPNVEITREQIATMLTRALTKASINTTMDITNTTRFADDSDLSDWGRPSVYFMAKEEIIKGIGDNRFNGFENAKVEEALAIALRSCEVFAK